MEAERERKGKKDALEKREGRNVNIDRQIDEKMKEIDQEGFAGTERLDRLNILDPYFSIEFALYKHEKLQVYSSIVEGVKRGLENQNVSNVPDSLIEARFNLKRELAELERRVKHMGDNKELVLGQIEEGERARDSIAGVMQSIAGNTQKALTNICLVFRLKYGQVELRHGSIVLDLEDAVLIPIEHITLMNQKVN